MEKLYSVAKQSQAETAKLVTEGTEKLAKISNDGIASVSRNMEAAAKAAVDSAVRHLQEEVAELRQEDLNFRKKIYTATGNFDAAFEAAVDEMELMIKGRWLAVMLCPLASWRRFWKRSPTLLM